MPPHTTVLVDEIPDCDLCVSRPAPMNSPAYADANLGRGWAYVCSDHFALFCCSLGLGRGQRLVLREGLEATSEASTHPHVAVTGQE